MLTRRVFQQLTDSLLLGRSAPLACHCARYRRFPDLLQETQTTLLGCVQSRLKSSSSASSSRWRSRQFQDHFAREAKVQGLKSRAAFKLVEMNGKYKLFNPSITVVDLGYAPGSWSQVAVTMTQPNGRVIGIDVIPAQPPKGASTIQGNFLSPEVQAEVRAYVRDPNRGRPRRKTVFASKKEAEAEAEAVEEGSGAEEGLVTGDCASSKANEVAVEEVVLEERGYIDFERHSELDVSRDKSTDGSDRTVTANDRAKRGEQLQTKPLSRKARDEQDGRVVDVVLSDMSEPWPQTSGFWKKSVSDPYLRMMNTSGMPFRDHAGSMDLCMAALKFCYDTLRTGGHFLCKFYQGAEDKALETKLKRLFEKVHREKPESSRSESKEAYFVALRRKEGVPQEEVFRD